jgi:4'-phosphopantetheinyl transferase
MESSAKSHWDQLLIAAHAWHCRPGDFPAESLAALSLPWLSEAERHHHNQFGSENLRHEYLAARALCRLTLSRYTGVEPQDWRFIVNANGKPAVAGPADFSGLHFNLTHTRGFQACIVSRAGEVGIDAEETSRPVEIQSVAGHFFSPAEQTMLAALPPQERQIRFFEIWVLKEACIKACGLELAGSLSRFTIQFNQGVPLPVLDCFLGLHRPAANLIAATAFRPPRGAGAWSIQWREFDGKL